MLFWIFCMTLSVLTFFSGVRLFATGDTEPLWKRAVIAFLVWVIMLLFLVFRQTIIITHHLETITLEHHHADRH